MDFTATNSPRNAVHRRALRRRSALEGAVLAALVVGCGRGAGAGRAGPGEDAVARAVVGARPSQIAASQSHACGVFSDGQVQCWGQNRHGELGDGTRTASPDRAVQVLGLRDAVEVAVGSAASCARTRAGEVWCWGRGESGLLGAPLGDTLTPVKVSELSGVRALAMGFQQAVAVLGDGTVAVWGENALGALGLPAWVQRTATPLGLARIPGAVSAAVSTFGILVLDTRGAVRQFGLTPTCVFPTRGADAIAAGAHGCARLDGRWQCGGNNATGALGIPTERASSPLVLLPFPEASVRALAAATAATYWVGPTGALGCVGTCPSAMPPASVGPVDALAVSDSYRCVRGATSVYCWGSQQETPGAAAWQGAGEVSLRSEPPPAGSTAAARAPVPGALAVGVPRHTAPVEPVDDLACGPDTPLAPGQSVAVRWRGQGYYQARLVETLADGRLSLRYESGERTTVSRSLVRLGRFDLVPEGVSDYQGAAPPAAPLAAGATVWLRDGRYWFRARVVSDDGQALRVRFAGQPEDDRRAFPRGAARL